jgi:hypothetical protein
MAPTACAYWRHPDTGAAGSNWPLAPGVQIDETPHPTSAKISDKPQPPRVGWAQILRAYLLFGSSGLTFHQANWPVQYLKGGTTTGLGAGPMHL